MVHSVNAWDSGDSMATGIRPSRVQCMPSWIQNSWDFDISPSCESYIGSRMFSRN